MHFDGDLRIGVSHAAPAQRRYPDASLDGVEAIAATLIATGETADANSRQRPPKPRS
jgi:hypothetical protein